MKEEEVFELCKNVFKKDKTPAYGYDRDEDDEDRCGLLPDKGRRWLTPSEMVTDFVKKHFPDKEQELFEK